MTLFSDAKGRKVVSIESAVTIGKVADYIVDPSAASVAALVLKQTTGDDEILPWPNIAAFGDDAVTVATEAAVTAADKRLAALADKNYAMQGKRVLTTKGEELGAVKDIEFDPTTGSLTGLVLKDSTLEAARLVASGSYAVIVDSDYDVI